MTELPTIESGKIWENRSIKEVLYGIMKGRKAEYAVARICSEDGNIDGEFLINRSNTIQGARLLEPDVGGWEALRQLLSVQQGSYSLLDLSKCPEEASYLEEGLKVRINQLVNMLPNLPDDLGEVINSPSMTRMRSYDPSELVEEGDRKTSLTGARRPLDLTEGEGKAESKPAGKPNLPLFIGLAVFIVILLAAAVFFLMPH